jgi:hypothetical protein
LWTEIHGGRTGIVGRRTRTVNAWPPFGKVLILFGFLMILVGGLLLLAGKIPWIGRLPGDIYIQKKNFSFYFPLTTSIIISIILTLLFYLMTRK